MTGKEVGKKRKNEPQPLDYSRPIWLQQEGETDRAYKEFVDYRDSENRRTRDYSNGFYNSVRWSWQERVKAWDEHLTAKEVEKMVRYRINMNERHRQISRLMLDKGKEYLEQLTERDLREMRPGDVVKLIEAAAKIESEASKGDQPDVSVGVSHQVVDMTARKADKRLDQLLDEIQRRRESLTEQESTSLQDQGEIVDAELVEASRG